MSILNTICRVRGRRNLAVADRGRPQELLGGHGSSAEARSVEPLDLFWTARRPFLCPLGIPCSSRLGVSVVALCGWILFGTRSLTLADGASIQFRSGATNLTLTSSDARQQ